MIGQHIQNYEITAHLGEGGMGTVYKATDNVLGREVALKMLHTPLLNQAQFLDRFKKEARILARLLHPNIAVIYNFIEQNNSHYMVMEFVEGKNLDSLLRQHKTLSYETVVPVFIQALEGLHHAHSKGIFHRDIKPSNLILTPDGTVKLMDFGIARMAGEQRMTQVNRVVGTVEFMAPELIQGKDPSIASDIYATAATMYELLTGKLPFESSTDFNLMQEILKKKPISPAQLNPSIPKPLAQIILKALEKKPEARFSDAREFQLALQKIFPQLKEIHLPAAAPVVPLTQYISVAGTAVMAETAVQELPTRLASPTGNMSRLRTYQQKLFTGKNRYIALSVLGLLFLTAISFALFSGKEPGKMADGGTTQKDSSGSRPSPGAYSGGTLPVSNSLQTDPQPIDTRTPLIIPSPDEEKPKRDDSPVKKEDKKAITSREKEKNIPETGKKQELTPEEPEKSNLEPEKKPEEKKEEPRKREPRTIQVYNREEILLYLTETIDPSSASAGQSLRFSVTRPVVIGGETVIEKGATAFGSITRAGNKKITVVIRSVTAVNGQRLPLQEVELSGRIDDIVSSRNYSAYLKKGTTINL